VAVPKKKTSPSKRGKRRSADTIVAESYVVDTYSGGLRRPHHIDPKTGMYRGIKILNIKNKKEKTEQE